MKAANHKALTKGEQIIIDALGPSVLSAAKEGRIADLLEMLVADHLELLTHPRGFGSL